MTLYSYKTSARLHLAPAEDRAVVAYKAFVQELPELPEIDALLRVLGEHLCRLVGASRFSAYVPSVEGLGVERGPARFTCRVGRARKSLDGDVRGLVAGTSADRFTHEIVATRRPVLIADAMRDPRPLRSTMRQWNVSSMLGVPVVAGDDIEAIVFADSERETLPVDPIRLRNAELFARLAAPIVRSAVASGKLRVAHDRYRAQALAASRALAAGDRLWPLVGEDDEGQTLLAEVAEVLGRTVVAYAPGWCRPQVLVPAGRKPLPFPALDHDDIRRSARFRRAVEAIRPGQCAVLDPAPDLGVYQRLLVAGVDDPTGQVAWLVAVDSAHRLGALDAEVLRRAARALSVMGSIDQRIAGATEAPFEHVVARLVEGLTPAGARRGVRSLGLASAGGYVVALVSEREVGASVPQSVGDGLSAALGGERCVVVPYGTGMLCLWAVDLDVGEAATLDRRNRVEDVLRTVRGADDLVVGMSRSLAGPERIPEAWADARNVVAALQRFGRAGSRRGLTAAELGPVRLLLATADVGETERFAEQVLGALRDPAGTHTDLLLAMQAFFASGRQVREAAGILGVHPNTIRYRMTRVQALTGLEVLSSVDDQAAAELALTVLVLRGELAPPVRGVRVVKTSVDRKSRAIVQAPGEPSL